MITNFLIINFIGKDDKLGLKINKDFFIHMFDTRDKTNKNLVPEILNFLDKHKAKLNENFSVIVNQGPGSFSGIRIALAVAKGLEISKKVKFNEFYLGKILFWGTSDSGLKFTFYLRFGFEIYLLPQIMV